MLDFPARWPETETTIDPRVQLRGGGRGGGYLVDRAHPGGSYLDRGRKNAPANRPALISRLRLARVWRISFRAGRERKRFPTQESYRTGSSHFRIPVHRVLFPKPSRMENRRLQSAYRVIQTAASEMRWPRPGLYRAPSGFGLARVSLDDKPSARPASPLSIARQSPSFRRRERLPT